MLTGAEWWRVAAVAGAVVSAIGVVLFWNGILATSAALALGFDVLVLIAVLWAHWPSAELIGN
jgi:hypothetical protein